MAKAAELLDIFSWGVSVDLVESGANIVSHAQTD